MWQIRSHFTFSFIILEIELSGSTTVRLKYKWFQIRSDVHASCLLGHHLVENRSLCNSEAPHRHQTECIMHAIFLYIYNIESFLITGVERKSSAVSVLLPPALSFFSPTGFAFAAAKEKPTYPFLLKATVKLIFGNQKSCLMLKCIITLRVNNTCRLVSAMLILILCANTRVRACVCACMRVCATNK